MIPSVLRAFFYFMLLVGVVTGLSSYYAGVESEREALLSNGRSPHDCPVYAPSPQPVSPPLNHIRQVTEGRSERTTLGIPSSDSFIDAEIFGRMERAGIWPTGLAPDDEFVRRIYIDLTGRIPTAEQAKNFLDDTGADKRTRLIDALLNSPEFVERMTFFFSEVLRNTARRLYVPGRNEFFKYIRQSVLEMVRETNPKPYTAFARELIQASGETARNGPVNFLARAWILGSEQADFRDDSMIQVSKVFLGTPIECISCHNGARHLEDINLWLVGKQRRDLWGMAAFFGGLSRTAISSASTFRVDEERVPGYRRDNTGYRPHRTPEGQPVEYVPPKYILTDETIDIARNFREELVRLLTNDVQFSRAAVNYLWAEFMGRGIVHPPHAFDHARQDPNNPPPAPWTVQPSHPALLDQLADEFQSHNFNIRHIIRLIVQSDAYQLSAYYDGDWQERYTSYFARHIIRRLTAEQLHDAIVVATGVPPNPSYDTGLGYRVNFAGQVQEPAIVGAAAGNILGIFESGNRDDLERSIRGSVRQTLYLLNDRAFIYPRIRSAENNGNLVRRLLSDPALSGPENHGKIVEALYLATLSRYPLPDEKELAVQRLNADRVRGAEDVHYALLNMLEFLYH